MTLLTADRFLYSVLTSDQVLQSSIGNRVYIDAAPSNTSYPFIVITHVSSVPITNLAADRIVDNELWQIAIWDRRPSYTTLEEIADRVRAILHKSAGTGVVGATCEAIRRIIESEGGKTFRAILLEFRLLTQ